MATQSVEFGAPPNQTLTVRLFAAGSDDIVATAGTVTAATNRAGIYTAAFTDAPAGEYKLIATNTAGTPLANWWTTLTLSTATFQTYEMPESRSPTAGETADAVWDEAYSQHTTAGTFGKLMDTLRKSNNVLEGTILASPTPTTTVFRLSGVDFPTGALEHSVLWMASGTSENQNSPIVTTVNNGDGTVTVTIEEALVTAPVAGDTVLIDPTSHVHAIADIQSGLATEANQTTLLDRVGAFTGSGVNTVLGFLKAIASKTASTPSDIGGTFSAATDSVEAIRDAMQAGTGDASQATLEAVQDTVEAIAARVSAGLIETVSRTAAGGSIALYIGDDARVRSGTQIGISITDVGGAIYTRLDSLGVGQLAWGASRRGLSVGAISGTIATLSQSGSGNDQVCTFAIEVVDSGDGLQPLDDYTWQIVSTSADGDEWVEVEGTLELRRRVAIPVA